MASVRRSTLVALGVSLVGALALAWLASALLGRRLQAIAGAARRVAAGDLSQRVRDYEGDELGTVARVLDDTVRELASRATELAQDRARTDAILAGMVEGVMAVNSQGRVQIVNAAAREMLALDETGVDGHYLEAVRHPGVAALLTSALRGDSRRRTWSSPPARAPHRRPRRAGRRDLGAARSVAPSSFCTTSPTSAGPTRCGGISSPTSRTSCGRR